MRRHLLRHNAEAHGGMNNGPNDVNLYEIGYNESSPMGNTGGLKGGSGADMVRDCNSRRIILEPAETRGQGGVT